jgi:hypothetical protein
VRSKPVDIFRRRKKKREEEKGGRIAFDIILLHSSRINTFSTTLSGIRYSS